MTGSSDPRVVLVLVCSLILAPSDKALRNVIRGHRYYINNGPQEVRREAQRYDLTVVEISSWS